MIVALKMSIGQSDGHSLDIFGIGEALKTKTTMAYYTFRFRWECQDTSPGGDFNTVKICCNTLDHAQASGGNERSQGTLGGFNSL